MNEGNVKRVRAIPLMLVLLVLAASVFSNLLQFGIGFILNQWTSFTSGVRLTVVALVFQATRFPFAVTIVLWLASRSGRTSMSTWLVPISMIVIASTFPAIGFLLSLFQSGGGFSLGPTSYQLMLVWQSVLRSSLTSYIFMAFAFRAATLHLRPVDATASVHRLSVTILMLLTATVAVMLSLDAVVNQWLQSQPGLGIIANKTLTNFGFLLSVVNEFNSTILWFSIAWLFVARNPRRWIGVLGLSMHWVIVGLNCFLFLPMYLNQWQTISNSQMPYDIWYFVGSYAVNIFHDLIALVCFGMIHVAGYRWDIHGPLPAEQGELKQNADDIPPVLAPQT